MSVYMEITRGVYKEETKVEGLNCTCALYERCVKASFLFFQSWGGKGGCEMAILCACSMGERAAGMEQKDVIVLVPVCVFVLYVLMW